MMLEVNHLYKSFDGAQEVLLDVSLKVEKGDVVAILGPSGSGKTTLLRCVNGLEKADRGEMIFDGKKYDMARLTRREMTGIRRKTAFVFQNYNLFLNKTVLQNVTLGLTSGRGVHRAEAEARAMEALRKVGMDGRRDAYPRELSGGQQQRVAIARGVVTNPDIIYFDEPTSALDPELIGEVLSVMRDLAAEGMTMLVVTHEMNFARNVSTKVLFMDGGRVIESGNTADFFAHPKEERSRQFIRSIQNRDEMPGKED